MDLRPKEGMQTSVKHPQPPQHPQHPLPAANENSSWVNLLDQADHGRLYKRAPPSSIKESTEQSHRDYFSGSSLSFSSKRPHRDYFSGLPYWATNKNKFMTDPPREAISLSQSGCRKETDPVQTPPRAALPDVAIEVGLEPPEAASTSRILREDRPPVILEIPAALHSPRRSFLNHASALTCLASGSSLHHGALRGRGPGRLPLLAVLESTSPPLGGSVSNGRTSLVLK